MLVLNERVRFRGQLCQVVSITPAGGNTTYKLKHVQTDIVLDGDFVENEELERVDPKEAAEEQEKFLRETRVKLDEKFGPAEEDPAALRDRKLEFLKQAGLEAAGGELPTREAKDRIDGSPREPWAPGLQDDVTHARLAEDADAQMDYSNPDGSTTAAGEAAQQAAEDGDEDGFHQSGPFDPNLVPQGQGEADDTATAGK